MDDIREEASLLSQSLTDIDNLRRGYIKKDGDIYVHFVSPYLLGYEKYRHYLLTNSTKKPLLNKYYYRPDYLSFDEYHTTIYWTVLMYINNIYMIEDFVMESVIIPSYESISMLSDLYTDEKEIIDLDNLPVAKKRFAKVFEPTYKAKEKEPEEPIDKRAYYKRETFVIKSIDLENRYVTLQTEPKLESVIVRLSNQNNEYFVPLYDVHYIIKKDEETDMSLLSWAADDCFLGNGMEDIILLDTVLEVQYQVESY